ncbi:hypothetical protein ACN38_g2389 [Penicillium nordicum]|uniref:Uncharacterized protein n=1 Tax=Penicillium nordicum TaxID=229535 RepID=A0A0M8PEP2_9EURO|nr:hypothetical protein ACN38_g2389 [Penicillium nordicum]
MTNYIFISSALLRPTWLENLDVVEPNLTESETCAIRSYRQHRSLHTSASIIGLVVEFVVAIDEARVRFTDDAQQFLFDLFKSFVGSRIP